MAEAREIAEKNGAYIGEDVHFIAYPDEKYATRFGDSYASFGQIQAQSGMHNVPWRAPNATTGAIADHTGRINVWVRQSVLESDQAITAVLAHEAFEVEILREIFQKSGGSLPAHTYQDLVRPGKSNNPHWKAVDYGDELVRRMNYEGRQ